MDLVPVKLTTIVDAYTHDNYPADLKVKWISITASSRYHPLEGQAGLIRRL